MTADTILEREVTDVLATVFDDASGPVYAVNPSRAAIGDIVTALGEHADPPTVRLLAADRLLKDVMDDFIVASRAADLVDEGLLELKVLEDAPNHSLLVTGDSVVAVVDVGEQVAGLTTDDGDFVEGADDYYADEWERAEAYSLRTPPISQVRETLESDIGPEAASDFEGVLASLQTARGDGDGLDEVTISLLVAAKNGELLYDISKWGEDIGLASKATFSRTKTTLEDMGLIDTEKVPIDVGRPRLRLMLGDERLQGADTDELANVAQSMLAS
ncbi:transcriptional regulator TbsP [Halomicrobium salinisoli]|uniref:transcriptional regulator TbsP n=1 Tax=Halomicrobium salinisoli TaxID=2878391 RepID=UPI001CF01D46|nr:DUF5821 family protein [Halomicrobium salinisoli]